MRVFIEMFVVALAASAVLSQDDFDLGPLYPNVVCTQPHQAPACGFNCGTSCRTYNLTGRQLAFACPRLPCQGGCECVAPYVLDSTIDQCVLPSQCSPNSA